VPGKFEVVVESASTRAQTEAMKKYGQFCPIAKAAELLTERWTLIILRELLMGSRRYNDIRRGVPTISNSVLAQRLRTLVQSGIVECVRNDDGRSTEYGLTLAGAELEAIHFKPSGSWVSAGFATACTKTISMRVADVGHPPQHQDRCAVGEADCNLL
jgi:DNA-binding HxlR family transcriptional regulator